MPSKRLAYGFSCSPLNRLAKPCRLSWWNSGATHTEQVKADTVSLLTAIGIVMHAGSSKIAIADWSPTEACAGLQKWKKTSKAAFGSQGGGVGRQPVARAIDEKANPANVPLPQPPLKMTKAVFAPGEQ
ncbi:Eukaryotic/viral aspartic protease [Phytophthora megakarya]|uniref:Eukaryotic/viral aspartic protease n=1 Tax=Phytophthora megakarya TaxID=4795 RepID=A0A225WKR8_9STRA|nr:Eukaryotic/viral aspartic protease [Phytophthora megakarya]